jgi:Holliday junction resolvase RusA-like endonuclease
MYILQGHPKALKRPRFSNNKVFNSQKKDQESDSILLKVQNNSINNGLLYEGPLQMNITFYMHNSKNGEYWCTSTPDIDNLIKYLLDVCNGILFKDDRQIVSIISNKIRGKIQRTEFTLKKLSNCISEEISNGTS